VRAPTGWPLPAPAATHIDIYRSLQEHYHLGHPAFLLGQNSERGWWFYFPLVFVLKTPLPTLLLLAAAAVVGLRQPTSRAAGRRVALWRWGPLALFPSLYVLTSLFSSVNIGYRHLLPVLPFLFIFVAQLAKARPPHVARGTQYVSHIFGPALRVTLHALLLWLTIATLLISPHYLAFFNELAGGPDGGYRYLVDSNLDWGQNLWQLRDWMRENGVERVYYAHFSPARPQVYDVAVDFLPPHPRAEGFTPLEPAPGVYAIGATVLQGVYTADVNTYAWFRSREPTARLGHALFIYRVPVRPAPTWVAICADPLPVLSPQEVGRRLGRADLRFILLDCRQSWIDPAGEEPGLIVAPPDVALPPGAELAVQARQPDGSPAYHVYRLDRFSACEMGAPVRLDGPLDFLGYHAEATGVRAGQTVDLWTCWQVKEAPNRPLSLLGHLVGGEAPPIAVGDGLGVPVEQWQVGDVIVQRHRFRVPQGTAPGDYRLQSGAYWLDTMDRWSVQDPGQPPADRIDLTVLRVQP